MELHHIEKIEELFEPFRQVLGNDFEACRNHSFRVFHFCVALCGTRQDSAQQQQKIVIASVFHDLGIWTAKSFDYLPHSVGLALEHLENIGRDEWKDEVERMIEEHHKLTPYRSNPEWLVEAFRRADLVDLSLGTIRFGITDIVIRTVRQAYPNAGFHRCLTKLALRRLVTHPFDPLPMLKW
ncbi:MAG: phosphohydrolase [Chlorobiaceae bacterium]|nr:phosphohydrolase [Chlorobiaceae bacterium]NTW74567.1 phosphohydrolase [Chlorobiaceae bacterium]